METKKSACYLCWWCFLLISNFPFCRREQIVSLWLDPNCNTPFLMHPCISLFIWQAQHLTEPKKSRMTYLMCCKVTQSTEAKSAERVFVEKMFCIYAGTLFTCFPLGHHYTAVEVPAAADFLCSGVELCAHGGGGKKVSWAGSPGVYGHPLAPQALKGRWPFVLLRKVLSDHQGRGVESVFTTWKKSRKEIKDAFSMHHM